jgi:hypothetical protein
MNDISIEEAFNFITRLTGGVHHVPLVDEAAVDILSTYKDYHFLCGDDSIHWWEEMWLIRGDVFAIGGEHGQPPSEANQVISLI